MRKVLIVSDHLLMAGAERLIYELVTFARANDIEPTVLIANNYAIEYYDAVYRQMNVKVVRTRLGNIRGLKSPVNILRTVYWSLMLRHRAKSAYESIQVIGLYNVDKVFKAIDHPNRFFWHVNNTVQHFDETYTFPPFIFGNRSDTVICINRYQEDELVAQYGRANIQSKITLFKLFTSGYDSTQRS